MVTVQKIPEINSFVQIRNKSQEAGIKTCRADPTHSQNFLIQLFS